MMFIFGLDHLWDRRLRALLIKETTELLRNRQLVGFLTIAQKCEYESGHG